MTTPPTNSHSLEIRRFYPVPRERVYQAWTDPAMLATWYCQPAARHRCKALTVDVRVGGKIRAELWNDETNDGFVEVGEYREIVPNERLVFTFRWEDAEMDVGETLMTISFLDRDGGTDLILHHTGFPDAASCDGHREGWEGCLAKFDALMA